MHNITLIGAIGHKVLKTNPFQEPYKPSLILHKTKSKNKLVYLMKQIEELVNINRINTDGFKQMKYFLSTV